MTVIWLHLLTLGFGMVLGYAAAWATLTRTRRNPMPESRAPRWLKSPVTGTTAILFASLVAVIVAAFVLVGQQQDAAQTKRLCAVVDDISATLGARSVIYRAGAVAALASDRADLEWKRQTKRTLLRAGTPPNHPLVKSTDRAIDRGARAIRKEADYLRALEVNPVPRVRPEDC